MPAPVNARLVRRGRLSRRTSTYSKTVSPPSASADVTAKVKVLLPSLRVTSADVAAPSATNAASGFSVSTAVLATLPGGPGSAASLNRTWVAARGEWHRRVGGVHERQAGDADVERAAGADGVVPGGAGVVVHADHHRRRRLPHGHRDGSRLPAGGGDSRAALHDGDGVRGVARHRGDVHGAHPEPHAQGVGGLARVERRVQRPRGEGEAAQRRRPRAEDVHRVRRAPGGADEHQQNGVVALHQGHRGLARGARRGNAAHYQGGGGHRAGGAHRDGPHRGGHVHRVAQRLPREHRGEGQGRPARTGHRQGGELGCRQPRHAQVVHAGGEPVQADDVDVYHLGAPRGHGHRDGRPGVQRDGGAPVPHAAHQVGGLRVHRRGELNRQRVRAERRGEQPRGDGDTRQRRLGRPHDGHGVGGAVASVVGRRRHRHRHHVVAHRQVAQLELRPARP
eukprot:6890165-Pyramimonas_sp.AAC.1